MTQDPGLASWLQLTLTPGLGAATLRELLKQLGLPEKILAVPRRELARLVSREALAALDSEPVARSVERALAWLERPGCALVTLADPAYPPLLLEIGDPPPVL
jgi:DNA processing protein